MKTERQQDQEVIERMRRENLERVEAGGCAPPVIVKNPESAAVEAVAWQERHRQRDGKWGAWSPCSKAYVDTFLSSPDGTYETRSLVPASAIDALRGEVERLRGINTALVDKCNRLNLCGAQSDQRADAAERRLAEVREIQRSNYGNGVGLHLEMILWAREYDALTKVTP